MASTLRRSEYGIGSVAVFDRVSFASGGQQMVAKQVSIWTGRMVVALLYLRHSHAHQEKKRASSKEQLSNCERTPACLGAFLFCFETEKEDKSGRVRAKFPYLGQGREGGR
jgi:hypothetical protein